VVAKILSFPTVFTDTQIDKWITMLSRENQWIWDSWYVVDGDVLHAFYLMAPHSLGDPDLRHVNARVGHSTSTNGVDWTHLPDALGPGEAGNFDDQAIWTGSIVKDDNLWHMFYTGIDARTKEKRQRLGHATSVDLISWERVSNTPFLEADQRYAQLGNGHDGAEHFRDPWVYYSDNRWNMLITASDLSGWGTIAHATSPNLTDWTLKDPLFTNSHILQFEVNETACIDGQWVNFFCMQPKDVFREDVPKAFGTYCMPAQGPSGPFDVEKIHLVANHIYAARVVHFQGRWLLFGFLDSGEPGGFTGVIGDPKALRLNTDKTISLV
jgi:beta-fructofuranosidase